MKKTILLFGLILGFLSVHALVPDHHEDEAHHETEAVEKKCEKSEKKCAEWKAECKEQKAKCHKGQKFNKCGKRGGCSKWMCVAVLALVFGAIGYCCGKKCGKCNCCCKKE